MILRRWSDDDVLFLKQQYRKVHAGMLARHLGRNLLAVYQKANKLGITLPCKIEFTEAEENILRANYLTLTNAQLADFLKKKKTIVRMKLYELGLRRCDQKAKAWTEQEDKILIDNFQIMGDVALSKIISGRTKGGVCKRRKTLNLVRTPEQIATLVEHGKKKFLANSFKPGHTQKIPAESVPKIWETRRKNLQSQPPLIQSTRFILNP